MERVGCTLSNPQLLSTHRLRTQQPKETNNMQDLFWFGLPIALSLVTAAWAPLSAKDLEHLTTNN